jgi:hypothetical protein
MNFQNKKQLELLIYKLLNDFLFLWLLVFAGFILAESVVPGFFSAHFSFTKIIIILFTIMLLISWLGRKNRITFEKHNEKEFFKNKMVIFLLSIALVLFFNSMRNFGLIGAAISSIIAFCIFLFFLKIFLFSEKNN